ncbi:hypothetical protein H6G74_21575 [Nostoc spongiaeforme FACHB-130]|uniref:HTH luxR-type domain-containing protein n=1 Tax=Nostoc spongiaeforme FACHB-130 TaxID=1357510 RepID=A0ABR8G0Z3_9NOSO|nr:LuxR C-terminal-related transcriptional regulator [Nostoc spongiaeforme]MBD2596900.1 hypothetical protein [Nostoc spongiaeforme FACHB-130]
MNQQHFNAVFNRLTPRRREVLLKLLANEKDEAIAKSLNIEPATVRQHVGKICRKFGLRNEFPDQRQSKRPELIALFAKYKPELLNQNTSEFSQTENFIKGKTISENHDFLGREDAISDLNKLVNEGAKVILIQAEGGVGKTTLARKWFESQGLEYLELRVGTTPQNLNSVENWVKIKLRDYFKENPEQNFMAMLEQLQRKLQTEKIGVLIDNLEPVLINGQFIDTHQSYYVELLTLLSHTNVNSITLITSREALYEYTRIKTYKLAVLKQEAWQQYFESHKITIDVDCLCEIYQAYGGNAEFMYILSGDIVTASKGNLKAYWQNNRNDLLKHRGLKLLIERQFIKLKKDNLQAYKLLCRFGYYPNHDITTPEIWLLCLLWDVPKNRRQLIIRDLCDRSLIKYTDNQYYLHPAILNLAIENYNLITDSPHIDLYNIKQDIDSIIPREDEFISFFEWMKQKSSSVISGFKKSAVRAFYFYLGITINDIVSHLCPNPVIAFFEEDFNPEIAYALGLDLTREPYDNNDIYLDFELACSFGDSPKKPDIDYSNLEPEFFTLLKEMERYILDYNGTMDFLYGGNAVYWEDEWANKIKALDEQLRLTLVKYRNIGHIWKFNHQQRELIQQYYDANKLLVYCLKNASQEVRSHIEDTLLLPIAEIEKRKLSE